jgi:hypothetical protein
LIPLALLLQAVTPDRRYELIYEPVIKDDIAAPAK